MGELGRVVGHHVPHVPQSRLGRGWKVQQWEPGKPEGDTVPSEAPPSPSVFVLASAGGCLALTSCHDVALFQGSLWRPSPSLQTERPGLGGAGGAGGSQGLTVPSTPSPGRLPLTN